MSIAQDMRFVAATNLCRRTAKNLLNGHVEEAEKRQEDLLVAAARHTPPHVLERLPIRLEKLLQVLRRVKLSMFGMVISELEVERNHCCERGGTWNIPPPRYPVPEFPTTKLSVCFQTAVGECRICRAFRRAWAGNG
jgi:hypothetical protein